MRKGWIKLYRKLLDHDLIMDEKGLQVFIYLLLTCNSHGERRVSRYQTAQELGIKPEAFRSVLLRLRTQHHVISTRSTNKYTVVSILKWSEYQGGNTIKTPFRTPSEHHHNTTNIINKNKEIRTNKLTSLKDLVKETYGD